MRKPPLLSSTLFGRSRQSFKLVMAAGLLVACQGKLLGEDAPIEGTPSVSGEGDASGEGGASGEDDAGGFSGASAAGGTSTAGATCDVESSATGPTPMRQLTATEYQKTVHALTGLEVDIEGYPAVTVTEGFDNNVELLNVGPALAKFLQKRAESLADELVASEAFLADYPACQDGPNEACASELVSVFGAKALRRPLPDVEREQFMELYRWGEEQTDADRGVRLVLQALLQDPHFIHRVEQGTNGQANGYEIATRLSYLLWQSMPDAELFAAAESGDLDTREGVEAQARRMMNASEFSNMVASFHRQWLLLDVVDHAEKDPEFFPDFDAGLRAQLRLETEALIKDVVSNGSFGDLFTATHAFLNEDTAPIYGVEGITGSELQRVELDPEQRRGILTRAGFLAGWATQNGTSPIKRGVFVRERILCAPLPPPPPDVDNTTPPVDPTLTRREQTVQLTSANACTGCHSLINPTGFLFENYNSVGAYHEVENGQEIDASGDIKLAGDVTGTYENAREFSEALAQSEQVRACAVSNWWQFAAGRHSLPADACELKRIEAGFAQSNGDIVQLLVDITLSDSFRNRTVEE